VVVAGVALLVALAVLRPFPLDDPVLYRGDAFQHEILTGAADGWGSPAPSADLAAPDSVDWSVFPTGTERLQLFVLHALRVASGGVIAAVNLYLLVGVVVTAVVAFAVLRWMGKEVEMVVFEGENHGLTRGGRPGNRIEHQRRILGWFQKYLTR